jgi:hypothetical protein
VTRGVAEAARVAYASGVAITGAPLTGRVRCGCHAAVSLAMESPGDPQILELALRLGHLEGTWAKVYERREKLTAKLARKAGRRWRAVAGNLDPEDLLAAWRRMRATREADQAGKPSAADKATAKAAALAWLEQVMNDPAYRDLATEITSAVTASMAEGQAATLALAADQAGQLGFDWAKAYNAMYAALAALPSLPEMGASWAQDIIRAAAADAGSQLAAMAASGAEDTEIASQFFGSADDAVMLAIDTAVSGSMARGALSLYASEGALVGWASAADGRVCPACQDNEDNSPYDPAAFPELPAHPRCRCSPYPYSPLPWSAFADFLVPVG